MAVAQGEGEWRMEACGEGRWMNWRYGDVDFVHPHPIDGCIWNIRNTWAGV